MSAETDSLIAQARQNTFPRSMTLLLELAAALEAAETQRDLERVDLDYYAGLAHEQRKRAEAERSMAASNLSMMEAYRTEAHAMTERAEAAEAQRDTLAKAARNYRAEVKPWKNEAASTLGLILDAALAAVAPPEEET